MSFASGDQIRVTHSANGYNNWSAPITIDTLGNLSVPPALHYFYNPVKLLISRLGVTPNRTLVYEFFWC